MRIAISAPPDVDKSAFARELAGRHGAQVADDPSKAVANAYGFQTLYEMPAPLQKEARRRMFTEHLEALRGGDTVFACSAIEWLADWMRWLWSYTPSEEWEEVLAIAQQCVAAYDEIHHLETGAKKEYDGFVWFDQRNAEQQLRLMHMLYADLGLTAKVRIAGAAAQ